MIKKSVFISNIPIDTSKSQLQKFLKAGNNIIRINLRKPNIHKVEQHGAKTIKKVHGKSQFAIVVLKKVEYIDQLLKLDGTEFNGNHLRIDRARVKNDKSCNNDFPLEKTVVVKNIPFDWEDDAIRNKFNRFGEIKKIRAFRHRDTGLCKGVAFIIFVNEKSARDAKKQVNDERRVERGIYVEDYTKKV